MWAAICWLKAMNPADCAGYFSCADGPARISRPSFRSLFVFAISSRAHLIVSTLWIHDVSEVQARRKQLMGTYFSPHSPKKPSLCWGLCLTET